MSWFFRVQPTRNLHLGNYLGAIVKFVALQSVFLHLLRRRSPRADPSPCRFWGGPKGLAHNTREVDGAYLAAGIDPKRNIVSTKPSPPARGLAWIFNCVARMAGSAA